MTIWISHAGGQEGRLVVGDFASFIVNFPHKRRRAAPLGFMPLLRMQVWLQNSTPTEWHMMRRSAVPNLFFGSRLETGARREKSINTYYCNRINIFCEQCKKLFLKYIVQVHYTWCKIARQGTWTDASYIYMICECSVEKDTVRAH